MTNISTRKLNAVRSATSIAQYPSTFAAILDALPQECEAMTAKQIAKMIDFGYSQVQYGRRAEARDARWREVVACARS